MYATIIQGNSGINSEFCVCSWIRGANRNYETGHQLAKPTSVFSAEISAIRMALEHIQICPRDQYLILSDNSSSFMAMW
jgi:hypothetical protein